MLLRALWKGTHHAFQPSKLKVGPQELPWVPSTPLWAPGCPANAMESEVGVGGCCENLCMGQLVLLDSPDYCAPPRQSWPARPASSLAMPNMMLRSSWPSCSMACTRTSTASRTSPTQRLLTRMGGLMR